MSNLKLGDRVIVTVEPHDSPIGVVMRGRMGAVCSVHDKSIVIGVKFDELIPGGHDCMMTCRTSFGYYVNVNNLTRMSPVKSFYYGRNEN